MTKTLAVFAAAVLATATLALADAEHANYHSRLNRDNVYSVPEKGSTLALMGLGLLGICMAARAGKMVKA